MKIAVVGSREFSDMSFLRMVVEDYFFSRYHFHRPTFISGGAKGADSEAECVIDFHNKCRPDQLKKEIYLPNWDRDGKAAGFIRNKLIIKDADLVIAFWDGKSKGTKSSIDLAISKGIPIDVYIRKI